MSKKYLGCPFCGLSNTENREDHDEKCFFYLLGGEPDADYMVQNNKMMRAWNTRFEVRKPESCKFYKRHVTKYMSDDVVCQEEFVWGTKESCPCRKWDGEL